MLLKLKLIKRTPDINRRAHIGMIVNYYEEFIRRFATILIMVPELTMIF